MEVQNFNGADVRRTFRRITEVCARRFLYGEGSDCWSCC